MFGVSELEYAIYWVVAAGFGVAFLGAMIYYLIKQR
jgi:hypothetical protein